MLFLQYACIGHIEVHRSKRQMLPLEASGFWGKKTWCIIKAIMIYRLSPQGIRGGGPLEARASRRVWGIFFRGKQKRSLCF